MQLFRVIIILIFLYSQNVNANIIRDSEIEETINLVIHPLKKASGLKDLSIYILNDPSSNAFTVGGNTIFINSGLIIDNPDPDILRGVIAHEMGHLLGQHIVRRQEVIDNYQKAALGATALGIATALGGGTSEGVAIAMGGTHFAERSVYAYSRSFESSADQTAVKLLEKSGNSNIGLINFFEKMNIFAKNSMVNPYELTHPMNNDRLEVLRESNKHSKFKTSQNNSDIIYKYSRISAKLAAYTIDLDKIANYKYNKSNKELGDYIDAIKFFRAGNLKDALLHVNKLLALRPDDPYYHELKAQIYFDGGKSLSSLNEYSIASKLRHNDVLIRLGRAIVGITTSMHNNSPMIEFYNDLLFVTENDPDNLLALHYMAIYYEKIGATEKNYLNTALIAFKSGRLKDAKKMASAAMKILPKGSPDWYKASDIVDANSM